MNLVYIGLGSNLGDKEKNISNAIERIAKECSVVKKSSLYETSPVGFTSQPWFLNSVVEIETLKNKVKLFQFLKKIEKQMGRIKTKKNGPRLIDLDILFFNDEVIKQRNLIVPHPRLHERKFVLEPLNEIAPKLMHPILKKTIKELRDSLVSEDKVKKYEK